LTSTHRPRRERGQGYRRSISVDVGDGKRIPIEDTHPDKLREALTALQRSSRKAETVRAVEFRLDGDALLHAGEREPAGGSTACRAPRRVLPSPLRAQKHRRWTQRPATSSRM
jgi:hypothetical protein